MAELVRERRADEDLGRVLFHQYLAALALGRARGPRLLAVAVGPARGPLPQPGLVRHVDPHLAAVQACGGDLDRVKRAVKLNGFVNCMPDFGHQPHVINGASELMIEVFGDAGRHARSAVGVAQLPFGVAVEIDGVFEVR